MAAAAPIVAAGAVLLGGISATGHLRHALSAPLHLLQGAWSRVRGGAKHDAPPAAFTEHQRELFKGNEQLFSRTELGLLKVLMDNGQEHVCSFWSPVGTNDAAKRGLVRQLTQLDAACPQGLQQYLENAKRLLKDSREGANPYEGCKVSIPVGAQLSLEQDPAQVHAYEAKGVAAAARCAFVLVAGGLGERLGYNGIKVSLPSETATHTCFLELYIRTILALQAASSAGKPLPLAIMTSDDTHAATQQLLEANAYFGAKRSQVTLLKQSKVPCLADNGARLALAEEDPYEIMTKPHGHGDVHSLLHSSGTARRWAKQGFRWLAFFQDTNALVFNGLLPSLGVSSEKGWHMNSLCVPRFAKESIGAVCALQQPSGDAMTINVEYNQLDGLLRQSGYPDGDVNDDSGFSPFPGNINQIVVQLQPYARQLQATGGTIQEFVNPKYKDAAKQAFKKPTRLECMMQDYPKGLPEGEAVGFTTLREVNEIYSPVKNSAEDARAKAAAGAPTHSPTAAEFHVYSAHAAALRRCGCAVEGAAERRWNELPVAVGPQIVLAPSFVASADALRRRLQRPDAVSITAQSSVVLRGDITITYLEVDGALDVDVAPGASLRIDRLIVSNAGWQLEAVASAGDAPEALRIRGFTTRKPHGCRITVARGEAVISGTESEDVWLHYAPQQQRLKYTDASGSSDAK